MFVGDKTPGQFKDDVVAKIREQPRNARLRLLKQYRDGKNKVFPHEDWKTADRNELCRIVNGDGFWNVSAVVIAVWEHQEFPEIY
jgi:hypothetical protein